MREGTRERENERVCGSHSLRDQDIWRETEKRGSEEEWKSEEERKRWRMKECVVSVTHSDPAAMLRYEVRSQERKRGRRERARGRGREMENEGDSL